MTINNSTISGNTATGAGGGIYNAGNLVLNNTTLSGNSSIYGTNPTGASSTAAR